MSKSNNTAKGRTKSSKINESISFLSDYSDTIECEFPPWSQVVVEETIKNLELRKREEQIAALTGETSSILKQKKEQAKGKSSINGSSTTDKTEELIGKMLEEPVPHIPFLDIAVWKSILVKRNPCLVRIPFSIHPYYDVIKLDSQAEITSHETLEKKKGETKTNRRESVINTTSDLNAVEYDEETLISFQDDYTKYHQLPDIHSKGRWTDAFVSVLSYMSSHHSNFDLGCYLWERIWPKFEGSEILPSITPLCKYFVKLYYEWSERIIVVDDLIPHDENGRVLFPLTERNEYWPTILYKALLKLSRNNEYLMNDPLWILSCLSGFYPQTSLINSTTPSKIESVLVRSNEIKQQFNILEKIHIEGKVASKVTTGSQQLISQMICATRNQDSETENKTLSLGLSESAIYDIIGLSSISGEGFIHLSSPHVNYSGQYSYQQTEVWNAEFEELIGFYKQNRSMDPMKTDFWMSLSEFQSAFKYVHVFDNLNDYHHQVIIRKERLEDECWLFSDEEQEVMIQYSSESLLLPPSCNLESYNWKQETEFQQREELIFYSNNGLQRFFIPKGNEEHTIRMRMHNMNKDSTLVFFSKSNFVVGRGNDVKIGKMKISTYRTEEEQCPSQKQDEFKLWFLRRLKVLDQPGFINILLNFEAPERTIDNNSLQFQLINNDTLETFKSNDRRIMPLQLCPNTFGYSLVAYSCCLIDHLDRYHLEVTSDTSVGEIESIPPSSIFSAQLTGSYNINETNELFRYEIRTGDIATLTARVSVSHHIETIIEVSKIEEVVSSKVQSDSKSEIVTRYTCDEGYVVLPLVLLEPTDKSKSRTYTLIARIDNSAAELIKEKRAMVIKKELESLHSSDIKAYHLERETSLELEEGISKTSSKKKKGPQSRERESTKRAVSSSKAKKNGGKREATIPSKFQQPEIVTIEKADKFVNDSDFCEKLSEFRVLTLEGVAPSLKQPHEDLSYSIELYTSSPNIIIQQRNIRQERLENLLEQWDTRSDESIVRARILLSNAPFSSERTRRPPTDWLQRTPHSGGFRELRCPIDKCESQSVWSDFGKEYLLERDCKLRDQIVDSRTSFSQHIRSVQAKKQEQLTEATRLAEQERMQQIADKEVRKRSKSSTPSRSGSRKTK